MGGEEGQGAREMAFEFHFHRWGSTRRREGTEEASGHRVWGPASYFAVCF